MWLPMWPNKYINMGRRKKTMYIGIVLIPQYWKKNWSEKIVLAPNTVRGHWCWACTFYVRFWRCWFHFDVVLVWGGPILTCATSLQSINYKTLVKAIRKWDVYCIMNHPNIEQWERWPLPCILMQVHLVPLLYSVKRKCH